MSLQHLFKAYSDGELSIAERNLVAKHLETNEADRKEVEDLRRLSKSIREYITQPEPVGLEQTLSALERAKPKARTHRLASQQFRWLGATAAVVFAIGLVGSVVFPVFSQGKAQARKTAAIAMKRNMDSSSADEGVPTDGTPPPAASATTPAPESNTQAKVALPDGGGRGIGGAAPTVNGALKADRAKTVTGIQEGNAGESREQDYDGTVTPKAPSTSRRTSQPLIQKNASVTVKVKNVAEAQQNIEAMIAGLRGYVQESNRSEAEGQTGTATLTLRVPVSQFDIALKSIRALGDVVSDSSSGNDVTSDVVDMDARLKVLRTEESDYMVLLGRARRTGEIMEIRDKLTELRTEIESITGQRNVTKDTAAFSTINVTLQQRPIVGQAPKPEGQDTWLNDTWATAVNGLTSAGKVVTQLLIFVLVWAPIWVPISLLGAWIYRKAKW